MEEEEIKNLIEKKENQTLEFKESFDNEVIETAVAFANCNGGITLVGVDDKGEVKGVLVGKETLNEWVNKISQATEPTLTPEIEDYKIEGKIVVKVTIKESPIKPVAFKGVCYLRVKNSNRKLSAKEIAEIHLQTIGSSWDSYLAKDTNLEDIDPKRVEDYIKLANQSGRRNFREDSNIVLKKLELVKEKPTWASILLFGKEPQRFLLQSAVHCGRFKKDKTQIIDDLMIETDLSNQVEEVMKFITRHISVKYEFEGKPKRKEIWEYPLEALREAVINAIVHRDYTILANVQVEIYDDRIEIWNPGKLPIGITIEDLYKEEHKSIIRNKLIAQVFYDIGFIERYGSGTIKIIELCKKHGIPLPEFKELSNGFSVVFRKDIYTEEYLKGLGLNERQINAVMYTKEKGRISNKEYRKITNLSDEGARIDINILVEKGILNLKEKGRNAHYVIK